MASRRDKSEKGYHRLLAWQRAHALVLLVYELTEKFPKYELFGLTKQLRDAAVSVPANIVEGYARGTSKQYLYHLNVAWGSLAEVEYYLELAFDRGYINAEQYESAEALRREVAYLLHRLIRSIARKKGTEEAAAEKGRKGQQRAQKGQKGQMGQMGGGVLREAAAVYAVAPAEPLTFFDIFYPPLPSGSFGPSGPSGSSDPCGPS